MSLGFVWIGPISLNFMSFKTCSLSLKLASFGLGVSLCLFHLPW